MRHPPLHRWMLRLALAAITLMVVVPAVGRLAGTGPMPGATHAMHGAGAGAGAGAHAGHHGAAGAHRRPGTPVAPASPQPAGTLHYDCGYCPLLASMVPPARVHLTLPEGHGDVRLSVGAAAPRLPWRHPWGLGSRGPPAA